MQRPRGFSPSVKTCGFDSSLQQSRAACSPRPAGANPTDSSTALPKPCTAGSSVRTIRWSQKNGRSPCLPLMRKVAARLVAMTEGEITRRSNFTGLPVLRNGFSPSVIAARCQLPHQVEPKERSFPLPSSDEEGGSATCRDDGRRDNAPIEFHRFAGSAKWVLSLSHRCAMPAPPSGGAKRTVVPLAFL